MLKPFLLFLLLLLSFPAFSEQYQSQDDFLKQAFSGQPPKPKILWINKTLKKRVEKILQHKPGFLRTRYWQKDSLSVWILEEIGKTQPITVGVIIEKDKIKKIKVLAFRESRGWEVKHDFFTDQFKDAELTSNLKLNRPIDGISGATLSVRALNKIARIALLFNQYIQK
jgi:hypothetical protein